MDKRIKKNRYGFFDSLRGIVLLSMIAYHTCWDLVNIYGKNWSWYQQDMAYVWQQSICWTFILLSGFCWSMGSKPLKRGLIVFGAGALVTLITIQFSYENRVVFGVLTCIGSCMLLLTLFEKGLRKLTGLKGLLLSAVLFVLTRNVNIGYLGFEDWRLMKLPEAWYHGNIMTFLGFPDPAIFTTDYFSLIPWFFLFLCGFYLYHILRRHMPEKKWKKLFFKSMQPFAMIGKKSLIIYLAHQPVIYGILYLLDKWELI